MVPSENLVYLDMDDCVRETEVRGGELMRVIRQSGRE